jgi:hypothetical protein
MLGHVDIAAAFDEVLAGNITAARARRGLNQASVAVRMKALGFPWLRQTVGEVEKGRRQVTTKEVLGLSLVMDTSIAALIIPPPEVEFVALPDGKVVPARFMAGSVLLHRNAGDVVSWSGDDPVWFGEPRQLTREDTIEQGDAMLRAETAESVAARMVSMQAEIAELRQQLRDNGADL